MAQSMRIRPQLPHIHIALSIIHTHDAPRLQVYIDMHAPRTRLDRTRHTLMPPPLERRQPSTGPDTAGRVGWQSMHVEACGLQCR